MVYDIFQKGFSFENTLKYKHNLFLTSAYYIKTIRKYKKKIYLIFFQAKNTFTKHRKHKSKSLPKHPLINV
jgi:NAD+--asparagine ADP-ribosyltransferase